MGTQQYVSFLNHQKVITIKCISMGMTQICRQQPKKISRKVQEDSVEDIKTMRFSWKKLIYDHLNVFSMLMETLNNTIM